MHPESGFRITPVVPLGIFYDRYIGFVIFSICSELHASLNLVCNKFNLYRLYVTSELSEEFS